VVATSGSSHSDAELVCCS